MTELENAQRLKRCPLLTQSGHGHSGLLPCKLTPEPHFAGSKSLL
jgi:hypothetical protein